MKRSPDTSQLDFRIYRASPGLSLLLNVDKPRYTILTATDDFIRNTGLNHTDLTGQESLQLLGNVGGELSEFNIKELIASFEIVIGSKMSHDIPVLKLHLPGNHGKQFWRVIHSPVVGDAGEVIYIIQSFIDITDSLKAERDLASVVGIRKAYDFFMHAPVIIGYVRGDDYIIELANEGLLKVWGKTAEVVGKPLLKAIPELESQGIKALLDEVRRTGKPFFAYEYPLTFRKNDRTETHYFDFIYQAYYEQRGEAIASGVISVGHDVTEQVEARHKFKNVIDQANDPILILKGRDMVLDVANEALLKLWNIDRSSIGKTFLEILPEMKEQGFLEILQRVYDTGEAFHGYEMPATLHREEGKARTVYFNFTYQPYREPDGSISGVLVLASDVTAQVLSKRELAQSQKEWRDLANSMPVIVWTSNPDASPVFFNDRWYEYTGLSEDESMGVGWTKVLHPDDLERCLNAGAKAVKEGTFYQVEARYRGKDGEYRWVIARGAPIKQDGKVIAWYGTSTDIHEQKQLETHLEDKVRERTEELEAKNRLLDSILKNSSNGIAVSEMIFDSSGEVVDATTIMANEAAVRFSGLPRDIYLTKRATEFDPNIISSEYGQRCIETLRTGKPSVTQYFLEFTSRWLELTISKMDECHLIHIFTDVTPIKQAQLKIEKSLEDLKYANANLEEFAYAASHDLKEPIRKIQFFSDRLRDSLKGSLDPGQFNLFQRLENAAIRMSKLIDDLLEYSQVAKGTIDQKEVLDLDLLVRTVLEDLELEIEKKQAKVTLSSLPLVMGNRRQMQQLFQNLISNALKYSKNDVPAAISIISMPKKGRDVNSNLPHEASGSLFHFIQVTDNGIGFPQKEADSIFKIFTRLHKPSEYGGTGIGLSIVKKVIESHDGFIWAESQPDVGSSFKMLLPAEKIIKGS